MWRSKLAVSVTQTWALGLTLPFRHCSDSGQATQPLRVYFLIRETWIKIVCPSQGCGRVTRGYALRVPDTAWDGLDLHKVAATPNPHGNSTVGVSSSISQMRKLSLSLSNFPYSRAPEDTITAPWDRGWDQAERPPETLP